MSRRCFEQMLDELDLVNFSSYHRWYASHNPACYTIPDMHQDFRNTGRLNRFDFYTIDYYRQPYWMPQNPFFPSYEPFCLLRRSDKRKNHYFSREKRNNGEKRFYPNRHEDLPFRVDRGKSTDFLSQFDRRYQPTWNRDASAQHYQLSRDERNSSRLSFKNSNIDLCTEDILVDQHLKNFKQVFENRNPPSDGLPVTCNGSQNDVDENSMRSDSNLELNYCKTSDVEWNNTNAKNRFPDGVPFKAANNFSSSYESWYCPEEQQQIIDTLKEVNLRHDRQLKRDMLLAKGEQHPSDESMSINNDSHNSESLQKSQSSEDDDEVINILLSPGAAPPIPETTNEEDAKEINSGYLEKSASDFFEEFQNIFSGSPERKIINSMTKESLKTPAYMNDEVNVVSGRTITEGDKKAVKAVLDFENIDDISEKPFENSANITSSSPKEVSNKALSPSIKLSSCGNSFRDHPDINEEKSGNSLTTDKTFKSQSLNGDSCLNTSSSEMKVYEEGERSLSSRRTISNENSDNKFHCISSTGSSRKEIVDSKLIKIDKTMDKPSIKNMGNRNAFLNNFKETFSSTETKQHATECRNSNYIKQGMCNKFPLDKNDSRYRRQQAIAKEVSAHSISLTQKKFLDRMEDDKSFDNGDANCKSQGVDKHSYILKISSNLSSICSSRDGRESLTDTLLANKDLQHKKTFEEKFESLSEPMLSQEKNDVVYKRISLSEIFSYANAESEKKARALSSNQGHLEHLIERTENLGHLSPSEHLKQLLGIGQNVISEDEKSNYGSVRGTINKINPCQCTIPKIPEPTIQCPSVLSTAEDCCKVYKERETSLPQKNVNCTTIINTPIKNELPESNVAHTKSTQHVKLRENRTSSQKKIENLTKEYWEEKFSPIASVSKNLNSSLTECVKSTDRRKYSCCLSSSNYDADLKPNNLSKNYEIVSLQRSNKCIHETRIRGDSGRTHSESEYKSKNLDMYTKSRRNRKHDSFQCDSSESSFKEDENMNSPKLTCKIAPSKSKEITAGVSHQVFRVEHGVLNSKFNLGSPKGKRKFKRRNRKEKAIIETNDKRRDSQDNCRSNVQAEIVQNNQSKRLSPIRNKQSVIGKSRNVVNYKYDKNLSHTFSSVVNESQCNSNKINEETFIRNTEVNDYRIDEKCLNQKFSSTTPAKQEKFRGNIKKEERVPNIRETSSNLEKNNSSLKECESQENIKRWNSRLNQNFKKCTSNVGVKINTLNRGLYSGPECKILGNKIKSDDFVITMSTTGCLADTSKLPTTEAVASKNKQRVIESGKFKRFLKEINKKTETPLSLKDMYDLKLKYLPSNHENNYNTIQYLRPNTIDIICKNESRVVKHGVSLLHFKILNSFPVSSPFIRVMSGFKYKTQQMLEKAEKIASLVEKRAPNLSLEEIRLKRSKRRKCIDYNPLSNANNSIVTKFSTCRNFSCKQSLLDRFFPGDKVSDTSPERTVIYTFNRIRDIDFSEFLERFSYFVNYKKAGSDTEGYIVRYTKEFWRNDNTEKCVTGPNELRLVKSEKNHLSNLRSNQEFQPSPLTDVFFEKHARDFISNFDSIKLSESFRNNLQSCLNTEIEENIFQTLPLLLSILTVLATLHVPWSRKNLKELYFRAYDKKKLGNTKILIPKTLLSDNKDCDILKCWDILSSYFT